MVDNMVFLKLVAVFCLVVNTQYVEASTKLYRTPVKPKNILKTPSAPEVPPLVLPRIPPTISTTSPVAFISVNNALPFASYPSHLETPREVCRPSVKIKQIFKKTPVKIKEIISVPPPPELPPLNVPEILRAVIVNNPFEVVSIQKPVEFVPYPSHSKLPAEVYGSPGENIQVFNEPPVGNREIISVSPPPELPPLNVPEILPAVIVNNPFEVVSVQKPVEFVPYPPHSKSPAEVYGPPGENIEVFIESPVEIKEIVSVPPPPELPPLNVPGIPPAVAVDEPVKIVSIHKPVVFSPYPPHLGPPAEVYGPPLGIKEVFNILPHT